MSPEEMARAPGEMARAPGEMVGAPGERAPGEMAVVPRGTVFAPDIIERSQSGPRRPAPMENGQVRNPHPGAD